MEDRETGAAHLWIVSAGLISYCVLLAVFTGDFGFDGDDWWVLSWPYWHTFPGSVVSYAQEFLRPVEGLYWTALFELVGFNRVAFHVCSLLLLAGASILMGLCLRNAFPGRRFFVELAAVLAFFLPTVSCLTYVVFTDNSRLSLVLFWASVLAFQRWATRSRSWLGLVGPVFLYLLSFLTYEASSFLLFMVPFLVWPVFQRTGNTSDGKALLVRLCVGVFGGFAVAVAVRMLFLNGGAVGQSHFLPPLSLVLSYLGLLPFYVIEPFTALFNSQEAWQIGLPLAGLVVIFVVALHRKAEGSNRTARSARSLTDRRIAYPVLLGGGIMLLGMLPYQMAGYGEVSSGILRTLSAKCGLAPDVFPAWFNFNEASRIYSSASCGLAILLAALFSGFRGTWGGTLARVAAIPLIGVMVIFHAGLSADWKEAASIRNALLADLIREVPDVKPHTNFIFYDLECYHKRAAVIRGWSGLRHLVRMLYEDSTLGAWYVYRSADEWPNTSGQLGIVLPSGFVSRGMKLDQPAPHDSLLLLTRSGSHLALTERISSRDSLAAGGLSWCGAHTLRSNPDRIVSASNQAVFPVKMARQSWTRQLTQSLQMEPFATEAAYADRRVLLPRRMSAVPER
jgi:hypothetical protein